MRNRSYRNGRISSGLVALLSGGALAFAGFAAGRAAGPADDGRGDPAERPWRPDGPGDDAHASPAAAADGRGRAARKPTEVPAAGWKDIAFRTFAEFGKDRLMLVAAGLTFYALLALFPAITALISIYGLFTDASHVGEQVRSLSGVLPGGALDIIGDQMARTTQHSDAKLGFGTIFGLGLALWSANKGMKSLFDALNIVYEEDEKRGFVRLNLVTLGCTLGTLIVLLLAIAAVVALPVALDFVGLGGLETWLLLLRWPVLLVLVAAGLSVLYRLGPSRAAAKWNWITPGGAVAAVLWVGFSVLFSWYVQSFGDYDETYGSLGAAIGFMTWIWISSIVVLLGAELNAEMEHQTARDTTTKPERPMGERGAVMADTLGEAKG
ncbi:YihY/virulence factor BrkB family protein [Aureimonas leprariae]|uniref:YihY/virulence factor BrkB family protein n=1 Tax=Plantimonas leprariae TaxID=2615207 RepID=A0A7V7PRQ6_9HYPH|nr:YihY/virulence factor BrkB family protein [Aureimonas leprariae]KAB0681498.1 YihY/virulence factor BrkB family protein [Aureimonas leprariae]